MSHSYQTRSQTAICDPLQEQTENEIDDQQSTVEQNQLIPPRSNSHSCHQCKTRRDREFLAVCTSMSPHEVYSRGR